MKQQFRLSLYAVLVFSVAALSLPQANEHGASGARSKRFGAVHFPVSCSPAAQAQFDTAVSVLHSFYYPETIKAHFVGERDSSFSWSWLHN